MLDERSVATAAIAAPPERATAAPEGGRQRLRKDAGLGYQPNPPNPNPPNPNPFLPLFP